VIVVPLLPFFCFLSLNLKKLNFWKMATTLDITLVHGDNKVLATQANKNDPVVFCYKSKHTKKNVYIRSLIQVTQNLITGRGRGVKCTFDEAIQLWSVVDPGTGDTLPLSACHFAVEAMRDTPSSNSTTSSRRKKPWINSTSVPTPSVTTVEQKHDSEPEEDLCAPLVQAFPNITQLENRFWTSKDVALFFARPQRMDQGNQGIPDPLLECITRFKRYGSGLCFLFECQFAPQLEEKGPKVWVKYGDLLPNQRYMRLLTVKYGFNEKKHRFKWLNTGPTTNGNWSDGVDEDDHGKPSFDPSQNQPREDSKTNGIPDDVDDVPLPPPTQPSMPKKKKGPRKSWKVFPIEALLNNEEEEDDDNY
jgi:hypothetical protein